MSYVLITNSIETKKIPLGFSFTTLFFGGVPLMIRGAWFAGIMLSIMSMITFGIVNVFMAFVVNKSYLNEKLNKGWKIKAAVGISEAELKSHISALWCEVKTEDFRCVAG
jgi:NADH:ubiquinone oxidoreductase subunit H